MSVVESYYVVICGRSE